MKRVLCTALMLLCGGLALSGCRSARITPTVTAESIRRVTIGMSEHALIAILGPPLDRRDGAGVRLLDYATAGFNPATPTQTISVWIAIKNDAVTIVHVERWPLLRDHHAIYEARAGLPTYEHREFATALPKRTASKPRNTDAGYAAIIPANFMAATLWACPR